MPRKTIAKKSARRRSSAVSRPYAVVTYYKRIRDIPASARSFLKTKLTRLIADGPICFGPGTRIEWAACAHRFILVRKEDGTFDLVSQVLECEVGCNETDPANRCEWTTPLIPVP